MASKRALITGITGQDGSYLTELLLSKKYEVHGLTRRSSVDNTIRLNSEVKSKIHLHYGSLRDSETLRRVIEEVKPQEIYNLAAQSDVGVSFKCPNETEDINYHGVGRLVHAVMDVVPKARIYQASTSEMFGSTPPLQSEKSPFEPVSPYGVAKLRAHEDYVVGYRKRHGLHISSGILFNHESPRRGEHFVTRKITLSLAKIKLGFQDSFELGNLDARRDWGYAGDYVKMMHTMLQQKEPDDYVIATGGQHTVRQFAEAAARVLDMKLTFEGKGVNEIARDEKGVVRIRVNPQFYRPREVHDLCGNPAKAKRKLGWEPTTTFDQLVEMMAKHDLEMMGKIYPSIQH